MSTQEQRIEVFHDTMNWINSDADLTAAVAYGKKHTKVYYEDDYPDFTLGKREETEITVTTDRSYQAAMRLRKENPEARIAVMNFANAFNPGGGVKKGSGAQEESLCRTSTLYPLLYRNTLRYSFYAHHNQLKTTNPSGAAKATDSLIYTEGVVICKTDDDHPKRMKKEDWVTVDVITIAAPDLRKKSNPHAQLIGNGTYMNNAELFGYHVKRAIHMLAVAAAKGVDILVLGAFGCGAFQNDPHVVAKAYKVALQEFSNAFKKVEFAVFCSSKDSENYVAFSSELENHAVSPEKDATEPNDMSNTRDTRRNGTIRIEKIGITRLKTDAIVNAANNGLLAGGGVCGAIFKDAGYEELTKACNKYGHCDVGNAVITSGFQLDAKYIIHAVGPQWNGGHYGEPKQLFSAYMNSLKCAKENGCHSIGFPLISAGIFGYPQKQAWEVAIDACRQFITDNPNYKIDIVFAVIDERILKMGKEIMASLNNA